MYKSVADEKDEEAIVEVLMGISETLQARGMLVDLIH